MYYSLELGLNNFKLVLIKIGLINFKIEMIPMTIKKDYSYFQNDFIIIPWTY